MGKQNCSNYYFRNSRIFQSLCPLVDGDVLRRERCQWQECLCCCHNIVIVISLSSTKLAYWFLNFSLGLPLVWILFSVEVMNIITRIIKYLENEFIVLSSSRSLTLNFSLLQCFRSVFSVAHLHTTCSLLTI